MNDFVDECRREWRRLRVPDRVADEMAAELAADLADAEKDGVAIDEVLGSAVSDPRSFAASWAAERGAVGPASVVKKAVLSGAAAGLAAVALSGAILMIVAPTSSSGTGQVVAPDPVLAARFMWVAHSAVRTTPRLAPVEQVTNNTGDDTRTLGLVLLTVGLAGMLPATGWALWSSPGRRQIAVSP